MSDDYEAARRRRLPLKIMATEWEPPDKPLATLASVTIPAGSLLAGRLKLRVVNGEPVLTWHSRRPKADS